MNTQDYIDLEGRVVAPNYLPIPVVLCRGQGVWLWDIEGRKYIDMMSAYSAVSHGHCNPRLLKVLNEQASRVCVTARAYHTDRLGPFMEKLTTMTGMDLALPMNTGAEAVETAIKSARRWGYKAKGIPEGKAEIIVCSHNFHGRTTTIISFSSEPGYKDGFEPLTPGFKTIPFGDAQALREAITPHTAAFLVEPIQGEAGIIVPPEGWMREVRQICSDANVLLIFDEVQSGLGRTGKMFAFQHEDAKPDGLILGKALGGGMLPVSAFLARKDVLSLMTPGSHGSTFGGNPLACAIGLEALNIMEEEKLDERSHVLGKHMMERLQKMKSPLIRDVRGRGLWVGVDFDPAIISAREVCERFMKNGALSKETHDTVVRLAPPLTITQEELDYALNIFETTLRQLEKEKVAA